MIAKYKAFLTLFFTKSLAQKARRLYRNFSLTFLLFTLSQFAFGQFNVNFGLQGVIPTNDFQDAAPNTWGMGLGGSFLANIPETPFYAGVSFSYQIYGVRTITEPVFVDGDSLGADVTRHHSMAMGHLVFRVHPDVDLPIQPYAEMKLGGRYMFTHATVKHDDFDEPLDEVTEFDDWTLSYGGSVGINIWLKQSVYFDVKLIYLMGSETEYLLPKSINYDSFTDELLFDVTRSRTDMLIPQVGVSFVF